MPILLGMAVLGGIALMAMLVPVIAGVVLGLPVAGWLLAQLWGELTLEWECRRPVRAQPGPAMDQTVQPWRAIAPAPRRLAIEAPKPPAPIISDGTVLEVNHGPAA